LSAFGGWSVVCGLGSAAWALRPAFGGQALAEQALAALPSVV